MEKVLLIVAAGNASRMNFAPKAASLIDGVPNLYNTVEKAHPYFDKIVVISNVEYYQTYQDIVKEFSDKTSVNVINSGRGCGHAVLESLRIIKDFESETVVCWGDAYFTSGDIFKEILETDSRNSPLLIPVMKEEDPYVWFEMEDDSVKCARFSKFGEKTMKGFHDQSIFKVDKTNMLYSLQMMHNVLEKAGKYTGEMVFLNVCHFLWNIDMPAMCYITKNQVLGFNTESELEEVNGVIQKMNA